MGNLIEQLLQFVFSVMKLVIIFGPPAVGKMTVGQALAKITDLKLFHNHMSLEVALHYFDFGTPELERLNRDIRFTIFHEVAKSNLKGLIVTYVWALDLKKDEAYIDEVSDIFLQKGWQVFFFELKADIQERLKRNTGENRLAHKPSKRNIAASESFLLRAESEYRMNTFENELPHKHIVTIDNTHLTPEEVALIIKQGIEG